MITSIHKSHNTLSYRILSAFIAFTFIFSLVLPPGYAQLIPQTLLNLPAPGAMVTPSAAFTPALINGITIHPENPLEFDFIVGTGDDKLQGKAFEEESTKLIKYFLASLTVPEDEMWVNLSPYEKDRIIPEGFGTTEMGRDLLAQDYILKQLTASLMYPEKELGSEFWKRIYQKAREQYGTTEIPVNTFNKVWIVPEKAVVYEHGNSAFVVKSHLKVMLEEDYEALQHASKIEDGGGKGEDQSSILDSQSSIIKEVILPAIEKEVNEGKGFANLRQIYNSAILAAWFKQNLRQTLLGQVYVDKTKTKGVDVEDKTVNEKIYAQYLEAFKKGVYNYIKEDYDPATKEVIPRKYFSGGTTMTVGNLLETFNATNKLPDNREYQKIIGEFLAQQKDYNGGIFNINLVELSEDMSVDKAKELIASSQRAPLRLRSGLPSVASDENPSSPVQEEYYPWEDDGFKEFQEKGIDYVGKSEEIQAVRREIIKIAKLPSESPIIIYGYTGTGKELTWEALHRFDPKRKDRGMAVVNVNLLNGLKPLEVDQKIESEISKINGEGIIVFDGIEDLEPNLQGALLVRLDAKQDKIRYIATRNKDWPAGYRPDLIARFKLKINLPSLHERKGDVPLIFEFYNKKLSGKYNLSWKPLSQEAGLFLAFYPYFIEGQVRTIEGFVDTILLKRSPQESESSLKSNPYTEIPDIMAAGLPSTYTYSKYKDKVISGYDTVVDIRISDGETGTTDRNGVSKLLRLIHGHRPYYVREMYDAKIMKGLKIVSPQDAQKRVGDINALINNKAFGFATLLNIYRIEDGREEVRFYGDNHYLTYEGMRLSIDGDAYPDGEYRVKTFLRTDKDNNKKEEHELGSFVSSLEGDANVLIALLTWLWTKSNPDDHAVFLRYLPEGYRKKFPIKEESFWQERIAGVKSSETSSPENVSSPVVAVMKFLPDEIGRGVWGGNLFAWKFNSRLNRITGGNESDKLKIAKEMGDLTRILMSFEGTYHDFFEVLKEINDKGRHFDTGGLVERYRTLILGLLNISDTAKQALRNINIAQRIAKSVESQVAGERIFQVPMQKGPWDEDSIVDVSLRITDLVSLVEKIMYKQRPGKDFQVLVKALQWEDSDRYYGPGGTANRVYIFSPEIYIIWPQANQVIEEDVKDSSSQDNAGVKVDILPPVLPIIPGEEIDRVVGMVKEYDALSETGERELRLFFAQKIKEISFKTFLEDKKDVPEDRARHIVVSAWLAAKYHLSAVGMRGLFVYFEDGTKKSFYELGMMRADSGKRLSMREAGEILAEGDILLSKKFTSASSPVAGLRDYLRDRQAAGEITPEEAKFTIKGVNDWLTRPGYSKKLVAKLRQLIADQDWAKITQGFYREVEFGTAGKRGMQVDAQGDVLPGPNNINDYTVAEYTLGLARYLLKTGQQGRGVVLGGDTRIKSILPYRGESSYTELQAQILRKMGIKVYRFKEPRSIGHVAWTTVNLDAASMEYNSASHNMWTDNGVKASNEFGAQLFADERSGILEEIKGVAPEDIAVLHLEGFNLEQDRRENPGMHILLGSRQDHESDLSVVDADSEYIKVNQRYVENPGIVRQYSPQVHSFYTPIQGAGIYTIPDILTGGDDFKFYVVISQKQRSQDSEGRFNTVEKPDPNYVNEETGARTLDLAIQEAEEMEKSSGIKFDFVFGTDPDADRSSYAVRDREGKWKVLKANDVWSLFAWYRLTQLARQGKLKDGVWAIETWVTTDLIAEIVQDPKFNLRVLKPAVGFNKIAEVALREIVLPVLVKRHGGVDLKELQRTKVLTLDKLAGVFGVSSRKEMMGEINAILREFLLFGAEESNGYSPGGHTLEKDGAVAAVTFHEIAAFVKYINHNKEEAGRDDPFLRSYFAAFAGRDLTIDELLNRVYLQYGYYATENIPLMFDGLTGNAQKAKVLQGIAELAARVNEDKETVTIGGKRVQKVFSGKEQASTANVQFNEAGYKFMLGEKDYVVTRPSGTEPYIRFYGQKYVSALELNWNNIEDQKGKVDHEIEEIVLAAQGVLSPVSSLAGASQIRNDEEEGFSPPAEGAGKGEVPPDASSPVVTEQEAMRQIEEFLKGQRGNELLSGVGFFNKDEWMPVAVGLLVELDRKKDDLDTPLNFPVPRGFFAITKRNFTTDYRVRFGANYFDVRGFTHTVYQTLREKYRVRADASYQRLFSDKSFSNRDLEAFMEFQGKATVASELERKDQYKLKSILTNPDISFIAHHRQRTVSILKEGSFYAGTDREKFEELQHFIVNNGTAGSDFIDGTSSEDNPKWSLIKKGEELILGFRDNTREEDLIIFDHVRMEYGRPERLYDEDGNEFLIKDIDYVLRDKKSASSPVMESVISDQSSVVSKTSNEIRDTSDGFKKGGIDLNPALLDLQIKRDGNGVPLPLPMQPIENMHIEGFLPVIINVTPITNLPLLLGLADTQPDTDETTPAMKAREPEEISALN